ncbi:hypothetical protein BGX27_008459 [Mortierella sp. AM989]|nr:hypothetical protein BGX27_008459 [Mortierella sp. AM989]
MEYDGNTPGDAPLQHTGTDQLCWLSSLAERGMCTAHRSTYIEVDPYTVPDPSTSTWDQLTKAEWKRVHGCNILSGSGMKYFSSIDPNVNSFTDDGACNNALAYCSESELRQKLEQAAATLQDIVKAADNAYGSTAALMCGTTPTIPESVSAIHYTVHTKFDETPAEVEWYSLRDSCQWLIHWMGVCDSVSWQCVALYIGFAGLSDDLCVPPWDVEAGTFLYHGLTLRNIIDMICKTGPESAAAWHSYLWNAAMKGVWIQYLEKTGAKIAETTPQASKSDILKQYQSRGMVMQAIKTRTIGGNFEGALAAVLSSLGVARNDICDCALEDAALGQAMTFDISKDHQGIAIHDVTNTLAENQGGAEANSRRRVFRQTLYAVVQTSAVNPLAAEVCEAFVYSPPIFTRLQERYKERSMNTRMESSATLHRLVDHISEWRWRDILP